MKRLLFIALAVVLMVLLMASVVYAADLEVGEPPGFGAFIVEEVLVMIPALYLAGFAIKKSQMIPD